MVLRFLWSLRFFTAVKTFCWIWYTFEAFYRNVLKLNLDYGLQNSQVLLKVAESGRTWDDE